MRFREAGKRLWTLIHNICTGQDAQPERPSTKSRYLLLHTCICWPVSCWKSVRGGGRTMAGGGVGADRNKMIIINCLSAECYDLWNQSGASWGVTLDFQRHLSCGFGSLLYLGFRCLHHTPDIQFLSPTHPPTPQQPPPALSTVHLWSLPFPLLKPSIHLHICFSLRPACLWRLERIKRWHKHSLTLALNTTLRWLKRERREL